MDSQDSDSGRLVGLRDPSSRSAGGPPVGASVASSTSSSSSSSTAQNLSVEVARQRALQAAEYYHKNVVGGAGGEGGGRDQERGGHPNGGMANKDALRAGVTPVSSDAYYKAKLRAGFIDLRNSYNEKIRPRVNTYNAGGGRGQGDPPVQRGLSRVQETTHRQDTPHRSLNDRRGLYRSNSSLELDYIDDHLLHAQHLQQHGGGTRDGVNTGIGAGTGTLRRDYGSASSLDVMSTSGESFFAMLQDYRNENLDQRAPGPPQLHEVLRGRVDLGQTSSTTNIGGPHHQQATRSQQRRPLSLQQGQELAKISNGAAPTDDEQQHANVQEGSGSPRLKQKSQKNKDRKPRTKSMVGEASSGIFKKLRGTKTDGTEVSNGSKSDTQGEGEGRGLDDRQKRKAFVHYDCQSVGISIPELIRRRNLFNKRKNTTTGASAASAVRNAQSDDDTVSGDADVDQGDGKSNDLVLACPFFRNEVGGEEERTLSLNRTTAQKRVQHLLGNPQINDQSFTRDPACNGVAVLDNTPCADGSPVELHALTPKGLILEHVDHGAFYYRNFFLNYGELFNKLC